VLATSTDTYGYVGTTETVARIANSTGGTTDSIVTPAGDRLGVKVGSTVNWFVPDLHGDIAGSLTSDETKLANAIRYDAYGETLATGTAAGAPAPVGDKAWTYQGRLDISPAGLATPLYDLSARFYSPGLGTFTQLDSVAGTAQHPLSMNRFLYAEANPATLVDPTGHAACSAYADYCDNAATGQRTVHKERQQKSYASKQSKQDRDNREESYTYSRGTRTTHNNRAVANTVKPKTVGSVPRLTPRTANPALAADRASRMSDHDAALEAVRSHRTPERGEFDRFAGSFAQTVWDSTVGFAHELASGGYLRHQAEVGLSIGSQVGREGPGALVGDLALGLNYAVNTPEGRGMVAASVAVGVASGRLGFGSSGRYADAAIDPVAARLPQDLAVSPTAPRPLPLSRPISNSATQNSYLQSRIVGLRNGGATDIRVNQQQVDINGVRIGVNRPDLQYSLNNARHYEEFETSSLADAVAHGPRILANDPGGVFRPFYVP
jgi:RHS repeat-associated protein